MDVWVPAALRLLAVVLLVLLGVSTVAVLSLNGLYDPDQLRPRHRWQPLLARNAILSIPCLVLFYISSRGSQSREHVPGLTARIAAMHTRVLRVVLLLAMLIALASEGVVVAENLLFHQVLSLTRTPGQTLNLLYAALIAVIAVGYRLRTQVSPGGHDVPPDVVMTVRSLLGAALKESAIFSVLIGTIFGIGAVVFFGAPSSNLLVLQVIYILAGVLCGGLLGGIQASRRRTGQIVRSAYALVRPLVQPLLRTVMSGAGSGASSVEGLPMASHVAAPSALARVALWQFRRTLRRHWLADLLPGVVTAGAASVPMEERIAEHVVQFTISDLDGRLRLMWWGAWALTGVLWWSPRWVPALLRAAIG